MKETETWHQSHSIRVMGPQSQDCSDKPGVTGPATATENRNMAPLSGAWIWKWDQSCVTGMGMGMGPETESWELYRYKIQTSTLNNLVIKIQLK